MHYPIPGRVHIIGSTRARGGLWMIDVRKLLALTFSVVHESRQTFYESGGEREQNGEGLISGKKHGPDLILPAA